MTAYQRLSSNDKHIKDAQAKIERLEKQLANEKQHLTDLYAKRETIESGIIQGTMRKYSVSVSDVEKLLHNTFEQNSTKTSDNPKEDLKNEE
ncbi:MAG: hypothetical protein FWE33_00585 [Defluviitaleaceae bacterium]|nr:hypothetical protein [Defluviitaleaceae bacterium]